MVASMDSPPRASSLMLTAGPSCDVADGGVGELVAGGDDLALQQDRRADARVRVELGAQRRTPALLRPRIGIVLHVLQAELERRHRPRMSFTSAEFCTPGSCTLMRSTPWRCTIGSDTPSSFTRLRSVVMFCWMA